MQSKRKEINTKGNLSKKKETTPRTSPKPTKTTIRSQTLISRIMATNYSIADQQSHPQWELDFIQMMHRLEAIRNQIHWSDNILLSLRTVNLQYLLNDMPTGYQ